MLRRAQIVAISLGQLIGSILTSFATVRFASAASVEVSCETAPPNPVRLRCSDGASLDRPSAAGLRCCNLVGELQLDKEHTLAGGRHLVEPEFIAARSSSFDTTRGRR